MLYIRVTRDVGDQQSHRHSSPKAPVADGDILYILRDAGEDKICKAATYRPTQLPIESEHYAMINEYNYIKPTCV